MAVSVDSQVDGRALRTRLRLSFSLLSDPTAALIKAYGFYDPGNQISWPALLLIGVDGRVRWRHITDDYRKRLTTPEVLRRIGVEAASASRPHRRRGHIGD